MIPVGQWGAQELLPPYAQGRDLFPRKTIAMKAGDPVDLDDLRGRAAAPPRCCSEATDRIMAAITRAARGAPRRAGARRAVRPAQGRGAPDRQPATRETEAASDGRRDEQGGGVRRRVVGHGVLDRARRRRQRRHDLGPARGACAPRSTTSTRTPTTCPGIELPPTRRARPTTREQALARRRGRRASPCRRRRCARTSPSGPTVIPHDAVLVSLMKGVELGTLKRMSEVIAEVTGAGPERIAVVSGPNLAKEIARREPAASRGRLRRRGRRQAAAGALCHSRGVPAVHQHRRGRLRARRRLQERHRASRVGHGRRASASATTPRRR